MTRQIPWLRVFVEGVVIVGSILLAFGDLIFALVRVGTRSHLPTAIRGHVGTPVGVSISPTRSTTSRGSVADEQIFRLILIAGFAIIIPAGMYHRVKSQASGERLDRRQEGLFVLATLRPLGIAGFPRSCRRASAWLGHSPMRRSRI